MPHPARLARKLALLAWIAFVLMCVGLIARAHFTADLSAFLPSHPTSEQAALIDQLRDGPASRLILIGIEGRASEAAKLAEHSKSLARALRGDPAFTSAFTSIGNGERVGVENDRRLLLDYRYLLSPAVTSDRFSVAGLRAAIRESLDLLSSSAGMAFEPIFRRDPTGELPRILDELAAGSEAGGARNLVEGVWMTAPTPKQRQRALLLAQTRASGSDIDAQETALEAIRAAFARTAGALSLSKEGAQPPAFRLLVIGPGAFAVSARHTIKSEAARFSAIGSIAIAALLLAVYRSIRTLALGLLPMATGALAGIAAVSLGFGTVHGITLGFGVTLIGEAVDYAIYLFIQQGAGVAGQGFWPTIRLGVLTSIAGFSSLLFSGFTGLAQLGLFSIAGIATAAVVTRWVLPNLIPENFAIRATPRLGRLLQGLAIRAPLLRWTVLAATVAALAWLAHERDHLWNHELTALSPVPKEDLELDAQLRADIGAPDVRALVVVSAPDPEAALAASEQVSAALDPLVAQGVIAGLEAPSRYLPSVATQSARQAALPEAAELRSRFHEAVGALGLAQGDDAFEAFFTDVAKARTLPPLTRAGLEGSSLALGVDSLMHRTGDHWTALIALRAPVSNQSPEAEKESAPLSASEAAAQIDSGRITAALARLPGVHARFIDLKLETEKLYSSYMSEAMRMSLFGALAIVALLAIALRSPMRLVRVCAPLAAAVLIVAAALVALGHTLTLFHLVGLLLIVAVGSNYALFFDRGSTTGNVDSRVLTSLLFANLTAMAGFGLLAFSRVPVLNAIGSTVGPGAFLVLILSAILARPGEDESPESQNRAAQSIDRAS